MLCCYLDDAGNTGTDLNDPAQPIHYNGALVVSEEQWLLLREETTKIRSLASSMGYKGAFELHGSKVFQGQKDGMGWGAVKFADRLQIYAKTLQTLKDNKVPLLLGCCNKKALKAAYSKPDHPHGIAMMLCLERIAKYAAKKQSLALVVADDCSPSVREIARRVLDEYRRRGAPYGITVDLKPLIDTIHFMFLITRPIFSYAIWHYTPLGDSEATHDPKIQDLAKIALDLVQDRGTIP